MITPADPQRLGCDPIPGARPAGEDPRYDGAFEVIEAEIAKLESLEGGIVDWQVIIREATALLANRGKHLLVAARLTRAWYQTDGLAGLQAGLELIRGICTTFWDDAFPEVTRPRARTVTLKWLSDGLAPLIKATDADALALGRCHDTVSALMELIQPRFSDGDCGLGGLRRALDHALTTLAESTPPNPDSHRPDDPPIGPVPVGTTRSATPPINPPTVRASGAIASRDDALRRLREIAEFFQQNEPHSPVGYLAQRAAALGAKNFQDAFTDLLQNNSNAQHELWQILGLKSPG